MAKINIAQLAAFRSGEVLTEQKLNEVFTLIGTVVNSQDDLYQQLIRDLSSLKIARRYLGTVETYNSIDAFINSNKNNPIYQPPNEPLPSSGDILFVKNNSDDPNLPNYQKAGTYMYIFTNDKKWSLYSPFAMVMADETQNGLMSKASFKDLQNVKSSTADLTNKYDSLKQEVDGINQDLTINLKNDINILKERKQDILTKKGDQYLKGYKTETVEGNLVEVKEQVDFITSASIEIWEKKDSDRIVYETINNSQYRIYVDVNKETSFVPNTYIKCYFSYPGLNNINQTFHTTLWVLNDAKNTGYGFSSYYDVGLDDWINLQIRYVYDDTIDDINKQKYFEISLYDKNSLSTPIDITSLNPIKIIKDVGVSDYLWAELLEKDIKEFLKNYMGIKKYVCYSNSNTDNFNGFRAGDILTLDYQYVYGAKSLNVNVGGINLIQGIEWEEYADRVQENSFTNQIRFLRDVNIDQEGFIEVVGLALVINSTQFKIWNNKDLYQIGEIVIQNNQLWYAKQPNINKKPTDNIDTIWGQLTYKVDWDRFKQEITNYIGQVVDTTVNEVVDQKVQDALSQLPVLEYIVEAPGQNITYNSQSDFELYKKTYNIDDSYFVDAEQTFDTRSLYNDLYSTEQKINIMLGWEPNPNEFWLANNYNLDLPNEVINSNKTFLGIITYKIGENELHTTTFLYRYGNTDTYSQIISSNDIVNGYALSLTLYKGKLIRITNSYDNALNSTYIKVFNIKFIEI